MFDQIIRLAHIRPSYRVGGNQFFRRDGTTIADCEGVTFYGPDTVGSPDIQESHAFRSEELIGALIPDEFAHALDCR